MLGKCARVRSPSQKQSALVSRHRRSDGLDRRGMCPRSDSSRLYLSLPQKADKVHKWRWVTAWLCFMRRAAAKRAETCCHWSNVALHFHRCLSVRQPLLLPARQPRLLCCNWTTPRHPGPMAAFPLLDRWPCHLAHMELAAMSRPQGQQSPVRLAGQLVTQPPILDSSRPDAPLLLADLLSPFVTPKKHCRMYVMASKGAVPPAPRRASAK
jgi:hypothetical protein